MEKSKKKFYDIQKKDVEILDFDYYKNIDKEFVSKKENCSEHKIRQTKIRPTLSEHLEHYDSIIEYISNQIDKKQQKGEKGIKTLKTTRKMIINLKKEVPHIKRYEKKSLEPLGGLKKKYYISRELEKFLQVKKGTMLSRNQVTCAICVYSNIKEGEIRPEMKKWEYLNTINRNLQNPFDKRTIIPDKKLSKLLRYEEYKKDVKNGLITKKVFDKTSKKYITQIVTKDTLHYCTIQKLLNIHFIKN